MSNLIFKIEKSKLNIGTLINLSQLENNILSVNIG